MMTSTGHKPGQLPKRRENTQSPVYDTLGRHAETSTLQWRTNLDGGPKTPKISYRHSSVATRLGCGGIFVYDFVTNFLLSLTVKEF